MKVDLSEVSQLTADMRGIGRELVPKAHAVVRKVSADTKRDARALAPVDTGALRSSVTYETRDTGGIITGEVGPTVDYGAHVEFGTSRMAPQAYMGPAFDRHAAAFEQAMAHIKAGDLLG